jgi:hypothetical protein
MNPIHSGNEGGESVTATFKGTGCLLLHEMFLQVEVGFGIRLTHFE